MRKQGLGLKGVYPALVTPFVRKTEDLDEAAFRQLIRHCLPNVNGVVTSGTTGEFPYLTRTEQKRLVEIAREEVGDKLVIAGCGASGTKQALTLAVELTEKSPQAVQLGKRLFWDTAGMTYTQSISFARSLRVNYMLSEDLREGINAFLDKRKPDW